MKLSKLWRIIIISVPVILLIVNFWVGMITIRAHEYVVLRSWCDENLPMEELLRCVNDNHSNSEHAILFDKAFKSQDLINQVNYKDNFDLKREYKEISEFKPLKKGLDYTLFANGKNYAAKTDREGNANLYLPLNPNASLVIWEYVKSDDGNKCKVNAKNIMENLAVISWKYLGHRTYLSKDILVTKDKGQEKAYVASYEAVRLKGKKALYVVSVTNLCRKKDKLQYCGTDYINFVDDYSPELDYETDMEIAQEYKKDKNFYKGCSPYPQKFAYFIRKDKPEKEIKLSADRRNNPRELYIKVNNRIFALNLTSVNKK